MAFRNPEANMIRFSCDCGRQLQVRDEVAGRRIKCPDCAVLLRVPEAFRAADHIRESERPGNEAPVSELRQRLSRLNVWYWCFLLLMPVGFLLPCFAGLTVGAAHPHAQGFTLAHALGITALALPLVGLAGWLLMTGDRSRCKTALAAANQADALGYRFSVQPSKKLMARLGAFRMFEDADHQFGLNCISGTYKGHRVSLLEYRTAYRSLPGPSANVNNQTVVIVEPLEKAFLNFRVGPKTWLSKLLQFFGAPTIKIAAPRDFNRNFIVCGDEPKSLEHILNAEMIELIMEAEGILEVHDGSLLFYRHNTLEKPEDYPEMIGLAVQLAKCLCA
jgi:hypothetical protein